MWFWYNWSANEVDSQYFLQIKTTLRFHLAPVRIAIIKNTTNKLYAVGCPLIFHSHLQKPLSSGFCPHQSMKTILSTIHHRAQNRKIICSVMNCHSPLLLDTCWLIPEWQGKKHEKGRAWPWCSYGTSLAVQTLLLEFGQCPRWCHHFIDSKNRIICPSSLNP
jgi:hypothetical protein